MTVFNFGVILIVLEIEMLVFAELVNSGFKVVVGTLMMQKQRTFKKVCSFHVETVPNRKIWNHCRALQMLILESTDYI